MTNMGPRQNIIELKSTPKLITPPQETYINAYPNGMHAMENIIFDPFVIYYICKITG